MHENFPLFQFTHTKKNKNNNTQLMRSIEIIDNEINKLSNILSIFGNVTL